MSINGKINRGLAKLNLINSKFMGACPARWAENADVREEIMLAKKSLEKPIVPGVEKTLVKMNRDELVKKAESLSIEVASDDTKAVIISKIEEAK